MLNIYLFVATLIAYLVKAITGFGNTLVMGSLFAFVVSNRLITPIDLVFSIPTNIYMVYKERKNISLKVVIPLSLMLLMGSIPGTFLLKMGSDWLLKSILGLVLIGIAIEMLTRKPNTNQPRKVSPIFLVIVGVVSGILAGLYGIGAFLVAYISRTSTNRGQFRANICFVFLADNLFRFGLYWRMGLLNKDVLTMSAFLLPAVVLGMVSGVKLDKYIDENASKKIVIYLLIVSGLLLFIKNIVAVL